MLPNRIYNILVYDVAAQDGGGLFVLNDFYRDAINYVKYTHNVHFIFLTSLPSLSSAENITILRYPWIKKSWFHRIIFDTFYLKRILNSIHPDFVISLQNSALLFFPGKQFVYLHQSLQFCPKKFSFIKKGERNTAIRQRLICKTYHHSLQKADHIYVQTMWIKEATKQWLDIADQKISVVPVSVSDLPNPKPIYTGATSRKFFYPARSEIYKNHQVVLDACQILLDKGYHDFTVIFTISKTDSSNAKNILNRINNLPIQCLGNLPAEKVWEQYSSSILLFPSYLETCGLPLLEAKAMGSIIIAADTPFAREALDQYENAYFFSFDSPQQLALCMEEWINGHGTYHTLHSDQYAAVHKSLLSTMMRDIEEASSNVQ